MKKLMMILLCMSLVGCTSNNEVTDQPSNDSSNVAVVTTTTTPVVTTTTPVTTTTVATTTEQTEVTTTTSAPQSEVTEPVTTSTSKPVETTTTPVETTTKAPVTTIKPVTTTTQKPAVEKFYITIDGKNYYPGDTITLTAQSTYYISNITDRDTNVGSNDNSVFKTSRGEDFSSKGYKLSTKSEGSTQLLVFTSNNEYSFNVKVGANADYKKYFTEDDYKAIAKETMNIINKWFRDNGIDFQYEWNETYYQAALDHCQDMDDANKYLGHAVSDAFADKWDVALINTDTETGKVNGINSASYLSELATFKSSAGHWQLVSHESINGGYYTSGNNGFGLAFVYDKETAHTYFVMLHGVDESVSY